MRIKEKARARDSESADQQADNAQELRRYERERDCGCVGETARESGERAREREQERERLRGVEEGGGGERESER